MQCRRRRRPGRRRAGRGSRRWRSWWWGRASAVPSAERDAGLGVLREIGAELLGIGLAGLRIGNAGAGHLEEVLGGAGEEDDERHGDDVGRLAVREVELDRHAPARRAGRRPGCAGGRSRSRSGRSSRPAHPGGARRVRAPLRLGRRGEGALADRSLGVNRPEAGVGTAVDRLEGVDDLLPHGCGRHDADTIRFGRISPWRKRRCSTTATAASAAGASARCSPGTGGARSARSRSSPRRAIACSRGMPEEQRLASWHLVEEDGAVRSAGAAFPPLFRLLPRRRAAGRAHRAHAGCHRSRLPLGRRQSQPLGKAGHRGREAARGPSDWRTARRPGRGRKRSPRITAALMWSGRWPLSPRPRRAAGP